MTFQDCVNPEELMNINQESDCWVRLGPHAGGFFQKCLLNLILIQKVVLWTEITFPQLKLFHSNSLFASFRSS